MEKIYFRTSAIYFIAQRVIWKLQSRTNFGHLKLTTYLSAKSSIVSRFDFLLWSTWFIISFINDATSCGYICWKFESIPLLYRKSLQMITSLANKGRIFHIWWAISYNMAHMIWPIWYESHTFREHFPGTHKVDNLSIIVSTQSVLWTKPNTSLCMQSKA